MDIPKIFDSEYRFCQILWAHEPIKSSELAKLCADQLQWKKSTTYTVIKRLTERGVVKTESSGHVTCHQRTSASAPKAMKSVEKTFDGSLPKFIAAFTRKQSLSKEEIAEIRDMIDSYREE